MSTTVNQILQLPILGTAKVAAGEKGLDREISTVAVMEVPDFHKFDFEPGVFILSTFSCFRDNKNQMIETFDVMTDKKISGMLVKLGRFIKELPQELFRIADEKNVPLILINTPTTFREITFSVVTELSNEAYYHLSYKNENYEKMYTSIINGESIHNFINNFGQTFKSSCACVMASGELLDEYLAPEQADGWEKEELIETIRASRSAADSMPQRYMRFPNGNYLFPCVVMGQTAGYFVVHSDTPMDEMELTLAEQARSFLSIKLMEQNLLREKERSMAGIAVDELLFRRQENEQYVRDRMRFLGLEPQAQYCVIAVRTKDSLENRHMQTSWDMQYIISNYRTSELRGCIVHSLSDGFVIITSFSKKRRKAVMGAMDSVMQVLRDKILLVEPIDIGYSSVKEDYLQLPDAYEEACRAIRFGQALAPNEHIHMYDEFITARMVYHILDTPEYDWLKTNVIDPLCQYDRAYNSSLWESLNVCFARDTLADAAKMLNIHISTLRYRLKKIEELTGRDYSDEDDKYILRTASLLHAITGDAIINK